MATSLSATIEHNLTITERKPDTVIAPASNVRIREFYDPKKTKIANGSNAFEATQSFVDSIACTSGVAQTLDLTAMADPLMGTINFGEINYIEIRPDEDVSASSLEVGDAAATPWEGANAPLVAAGSTVRVGPGGPTIFQSWVDGFDVTAGTKYLKIVPAYTGSYTLIIIGD